MTIIILGMHRSGTSAITRLVADMGAYIAPESMLLPASEDNPQGFWERKDVLAINRAILKAQNCNWYQVEGFDSAHPLPPELREPMLACTRQLQGHTPFVVKDPRFCLTLPYWRPHFPKPVIILALRHPAAIAHSLELRNAMPLEQGLALWENYMTHALRHIEGLPIIRYQFESLMAKPEKAVAALHGALHKHFPTLKLPDVASFNPALARAAADNIALSEKQQALYEVLRTFTPEEVKK